MVWLELEDRAVPAMVDTGIDVHVMSTQEFVGPRAGAAVTDVASRTLQVLIRGQLSTAHGVKQTAVVYEGPLTVLGHEFDRLPVVRESSAADRGGGAEGFPPDLRLPV